MLTFLARKQTSMTFEEKKKILLLTKDWVGMMEIMIIKDQCLTLKALPSVILHFPPDGLVRIFLQLLQAMTDWA